jgi:histidinol-phosphate aminotransferase
MKILARTKILDVEPYEPGKPIKELQRELGIKESDIIKLASNENPIGPSPKAVEAIVKAVKGVNRYPDGSGFYLKKKLSAAVGLRPANIVLGNGSDELIDITTKAFLEEDEEAIISSPSFLEYKIIVTTRGARVKAVPMDGPTALGKDSLSKAFRYNIDNILKSITKKTKLIFIGNPDNPTGAYVTTNALKVLLDRCPKRIIIVFDEAYRELVDRRDYSNPLPYIKRGNIIILRTFSKAYGLAGLRIGYALASESLSGWMERVRLPFNINMLAQAAAEAALDDRTHLNNTKRLIKEGMRFLVLNLTQLGFEIIEGPANFLLFSYKNIEGSRFFKELLPYGIITRDMKAYGLSRWVRVNAGTVPENRKFISTVSQLINSVG